MEKDKEATWFLKNKDKCNVDVYRVLSVVRHRMTVVPRDVKVK